MDTKHTPGKWRIETPCGFPYSGVYVVPDVPKDFPFHIAQIRQLREREESEANAEFIIRACNSHDALLAACKRALPCLKGLADKFPTKDREANVVFEMIKSAISQAGESGE